MIWDMNKRILLAFHDKWLPDSTIKHQTAEIIPQSNQAHRVDLNRNQAEDYNQMKAMKISSK